eukprot:EG_transcript_22916
MRSSQFVRETDLDIVLRRGVCVFARVCDDVVASVGQTWPVSNSVPFFSGQSGTAAKSKAPSTMCFFMGVCGKMAGNNQKTHFQGSRSTLGVKTNTRDTHFAIAFLWIFSLH